MTQAYSMTRRSFILDNPGRKYVLTVRDLPLEDKPREKMIARGPSILSAQELLAALLNTGTTKEEVLAMSTRIMCEYGEHSIMRATDPTTLSKNLEIPIGKAIQIVAAAELGRRFYERNGASSPVIRTAQDVFEYAKDIRDLPKEHLRGIYLNTHYKIIHDEVISIGTIDANIVHPREVFKPALAYSAAAVVLVHNHPSGVAEPSATDCEVTRQLVDAGRILGIDLVDHVVVTKDSFTSVPCNYQV
jgi:DNA repair protein RadC